MRATPHYGYVQLSNMFWRSAKTFTLLRANPAALGYFTVLLSWSGDNLSDGLLPGNVITGLFAVPDDVLAALVSVGFLEQVQDGYQIHDYLDWNRSRTEIEQGEDRKREQARLRKQKQRGKEATQPANCEESVSVTHMSRSCHAPVTHVSRTSHTPVTPLSRTTTELQNDKTTEQSFSSKPSFSKFASTAYQPDEKEKNKMKETHKISEAHYVKLLAGFHDWWDGQDELKSQSQWNHFLDGWIAKNKDNPKFQAHKHTWACEHTLHALSVASTAELTSRYEQAGNLTYGNQLAQRVSSLLNVGVSEREAVRQARASVSAGGDADSFQGRRKPLEASNRLDQALVQAGGLQTLYTPVKQLVGA